MAPRLVEVRRPQPNDVIVSDFTVAGFRTGFEATVLWQLVDRNGQSVAQGNIQGAGSMGVIRDFGHQVSVGGYTARAAQMTLQVFGDDPSGVRPPGTDINLVALTLYTAFESFRLYEVEASDTLTKIAREQGQRYRRPRLAGMEMAVVAAGRWMPTQKSASPQYEARAAEFCQGVKSK